MDNLPEDIQNKIYKMAHQMEFNNVMCELENDFDEMAYCLADWVYGRCFTIDDNNNIREYLYATDIFEFNQKNKCIELTTYYQLY